MSLAIQFGDSSDPFSLAGAIYFDAVTQYSRDYSGKVTEHPLEAGALVTDHYVSNNPKFSISGVISNVDFSNIPSQITVNGESVINNNKQPSPVKVTDMSGIRKYVPGVLDQFFGRTMPIVEMDNDERVNFKYYIEDFFAQLLAGLYWNQKRQKYENRMTTAILWEVDSKGVPVRPLGDLVCTACQINEDEETGDAMILSVNLEQVIFVTSEKAQAPKPRKGPVARKAEEKKDKGPVSTDVKNPPNERATVSGELEKAKKASGG